MNEILHHLPTSPTREGSDCITYHQDDFGHNNHSTTSSSVPKPAVMAQWSMDCLARALENSDQSIQVNVKDFEGKLNADEYCDWIAFLQAFFE
nr:hypothetical protein CFP56_23013 [Quercus suber]